MRVKLLCGEEAATVLLVDLARLSEYGRALDTLRPACLRGRHRRTARPVDLLDNATHARQEISISGCTTGSYRAKRRAKRTCTPRPRISAIEVIRAARKQRLEASSDTPTTTPVCPTSSSRTPVTHQASDRADDPSRHRAVRPTATTPGSIQKHKPVGASDARPRQTAHRPNGVEQTTAARASSPAPTTKCPNQLGRPITDRIERHRAINPQRCDASFTTRRRRRLASQLHTFSTAAVQRRTGAAARIQPHDRRPQGLELHPRGLRANTPDAGDNASPISSRTPRYASCQATDRPDARSRHRAVRPTAATPGSIQKHKPSAPRTHGRVKPPAEQTASSRRPPHAHRVPAPEAAQATKCSNQLGRPTTDRIEATRATNPAHEADRGPAGTRRVTRPGQRRADTSQFPHRFPEGFEPTSTGGVARRPDPGSPECFERIQQR